MLLKEFQNNFISDKDILFLLRASSSSAAGFEKSYPDHQCSFIDTSGHVPIDFSPIYKAIGQGRSFSIIILDDYFEEVFEQLHADPVISEAVDIVFFYPSAETAYMLSYRKKYSSTPLQNMILFRSGPHATQYVKGMDYADNARALFEYMLAQGLNRKYELVWLVKDPEEYRDLAEDHENVSLIAFDWSTSDDAEEREKYYRALYLSKWIFMTDAYGFCRLPREGQVRVQLWHGSGFKGRVNSPRCEHRYEYTVCPSENYKRIHADLFGLRDDQVLVTGIPKDDKVLHPDPRWRESFGVPEAGKYIFWMPTFRKSLSQLGNLNEQGPADDTGLPVLETQEDLRELNDLLVKKNAILVIKLHPFQDRTAVHVDEFSNIRVLSNEPFQNERADINSILGNADALISDYSSAAIDFMILNRPLAFTIDDAEAYENSRGFVFHPIRDYLPGAVIRDAKDLEEFISQFLDGNDISEERRSRLIPLFQSHFDDRSSERLLKRLGIL